MPANQVAAVVCGAGIAGISAAFHLARAGISPIAIVDPRPPLTLTSDKSTECYRNWWPSQPMVSLMNRSIAILESLAAETGNVFALNRRGYLYVTARPEGVEKLESDGAAISSLGAGELRIHRSARFPDSRVSHGADLILGADTVRSHFPWLTPRTRAVLWVRRAGWMSAQQLGAWMLEDAKSRGARLVPARVSGVETSGGRVSAVHLDDGTEITTPVFVNAAGPLLSEVGLMLGIEIPVTSEIHHKIAFKDSAGAVPRSAPMTIWTDPQTLAWSATEVEGLLAAGRQDLVGEMPPACHGRPEGGAGSPWVLALWEYRRVESGPIFPLPQDPFYPEVVMRGMATMIPGLEGYLERLPQPYVDGGLYTKTIDNRPLVGPIGPPGSFICGALSGFGVMAATGVGELLTSHVRGAGLPEYAGAFTIDRFDGPLELPHDDGQL